MAITCFISLDFFKISTSSQQQFSLMKTNVEMITFPHRMPSTYTRVLIRIEGELILLLSVCCPHILATDIFGYKLQCDLNNDVRKNRSIF